MTRNEKKHYTQKFMPSYLRGINIAAPAVIIGLVLILFVALIISAFALPDLNLTGKIFIIFVFVFIVALIVLISLIIAFNKKLVAQRKKELEEEYTEMSLEEAKAALTARGIINDTGFVITSMSFADGSGVVPVLPFNDTKVCIFSANVCSKVLTVVSFCNQGGAVMAEYFVDNAFYNFIEKSNLDVMFYGGSEMLFGDKGAFVKKVIKTRNSRGAGLTVMFGAIGAAVAEHERDEAPEMQAVLRVLRRENI